jgi:hypothetical protein
MYMNLPIAYDDHGDIPLGTPFHELRPEHISFYLEMNTRVGKSTCRQTCAHCFYITEKEAQDRVMDLRDGRRLMEDLRARGYRVFPLISDNFADGGEYLRVFGDPQAASPVHDDREGPERLPTRTMEKGEMWTSGAPLLDESWQDLLCTGIENGFGTVTITFHGVPGEDLALRPRHEYPIRGVFHGLDTEIVIARVHRFNEDMAAGRIARLASLPASAREPLRLNMTVTVGKHNHTMETLERYARYFAKQRVSFVRFNRFHDHGFRHPHLVLSSADVAQFYRDIRWIHENLPLPFQLSVSEDFGTHGIEVMGFPAHTGHCRAGHQFFAIAADPLTLIDDDDTRRRESMGIIVGCVEAYKPILGRVVCITDKSTGARTHDVEFSAAGIAELQRKRTNGTYRDGCFAPELLHEIRRAEQEPSAAPSLATLRLPPRAVQRAG